MITVRDSGWRQHVRAVEASALHRARVGILACHVRALRGAVREEPKPREAARRPGRWDARVPDRVH